MVGIVFQDSLYQNLRQKVYCRDELVMQEGDTGDEMYVRLGGSLKLKLRKRDGLIGHWIFFRES